MSHPQPSPAAWTEARATGPDAALSLRLVVAQGRVARVDVRPSVRAGVLAALTGRPVGTAIPTVGLLFAVCGRAHVVAALRAVEAARNHHAPPAVEAARDALVTVEALDQAALTLLLDGPSVFGLEPEVTALRALRADLAAVARAAARPGWDAVGGASGVTAPWPPADLAPAVAALSRRLGRILPADGAPTATALRLQVRLDPAPVARVLAAALAEPPHAPPPPRLLRDWTLPALAAALRGADADAFVLRPTWQGAPAETGALARHADHAPVRDLWAEGAPVAARLAARCRDMVDGLDSLRKAACDAEPDPEPRAPTAMADAPGTGLAAVETARGLLVHRVTQAGGRIADWRVLAPTEWTFHPEGALPATVTGWDAGDPAALVRRVRRLVAAMDPCVTCDIRVEEAARA